MNEMRSLLDYLITQGTEVPDPRNPDRRVQACQAQFHFKDGRFVAGLCKPFAEVPGCYELITVGNVKKENGEKTPLVVVMIFAPDALLHIDLVAVGQEAPRILTPDSRLITP
jgi:hypothetical protein